MTGLLQAVFGRDLPTTTATLARLQAKAYPRAQARLIADPALVELTSTTIPAAYEQLPRITPQAMEQISDAGLIVLEAMRQQELRVRGGKPPLLATDEQIAATEAGNERVGAVTGRHQTSWGQVWFGIRVVTGL